MINSILKMELRLKVNSKCILIRKTSKYLAIFPITSHLKGHLLMVSYYEPTSIYIYLIHIAFNVLFSTLCS
ncbi:hypothetical protein Hanom_Chr10g00910451 [Helianthus anomalus]